MMSQFLFPFHETHHPVARTSALQRLVDWSKESEPGPMLICGPPGVGKTELVVQFALKYQSRFPGGICWIQADSHGILAGYSMFAVEAFDMEIPFMEAPTPQDRFAQIMQAWPQNGRVLVVIEDEDSHSDVQSFVPKDASFYTIVTTSQEIVWNSNCLHLDNLTQEDAKAWMLTNPHFNESSEISEDILKIVQMLKGDFFGLKWLHAYLMNSFLQYRIPKIKEIMGVCDEAKGDQSKVLHAVFGLVWGNLHQQSQQLATLISDLPSACVPWRLIELAASQICDPIELDTCRRFLLRYDLIRQRGESLFEMHPQVTRCIRHTRSPLQSEKQSMQGYLKAVIQIADKIPEYPPSEDWVNLFLFVPYFEHVLLEHHEAISAESLGQIIIASSALLQGMNELERALTICQSGCITILTKDEKSPDKMVYIYHHQLIINMLLKRPKDALNATLQQLDWLRQTENSPFRRLKSSIEMVVYLAKETKQPDVASAFEKQLIELMDTPSEGDPVESFHRIQEKELVLRRRGEKKEVLECSLQLLELAEIHPVALAKNWARTWKQLFLDLELNEQSHRSEEILKRSLAILVPKREEYLAAIAEIHVELSREMLTQGREKDALEYFQFAMEAVLKKGDDSSLFHAVMLKSMCQIALKLRLDEMHDTLKKRLEND